LKPFGGHIGSYLTAQHSPRNENTVKGRISLLRRPGLRAGTASHKTYKIPDHVRDGTSDRHSVFRKKNA
jgi:hypothetical protein